jgi:small-conductance mechanosensitive channel
MTKLILSFFLLILLAFAPLSAKAQGLQFLLAQAAAPPPAAQPPQAAKITPDEAQRALDVLTDDKKRAQLVETLQTIAKAAPPAQAPTPKPAEPIPLKPNGLGIQLLNDVSDRLTDVVGDFGAMARAVTDFPQLWHWLNHIETEPRTRAGLIEAVWKLAVVMASALLVEWLVGRLVARPIRYLAATAPGDSNGEAENGSRGRRRIVAAWKLLVRLPYGLARLILDLLPIGAFAAVGNLVIGGVVPSTTSTRLIILAMVNAYALCRAAMCLVRFFVSPGCRNLALVHVSDETAAYVEVWMRRLVVVGVFGVALAGIARILGLQAAAHEALIKIVALILHLFLVIIVLQCRRAVAGYIAGPTDATGAIAMIRQRLSDLWHYLAIFLILASWVIWAVQVRDGFQRLLHFLAVTTAVFVAVRLAAIVLLGLLDRIFRVNRDVKLLYPNLEARANRYYPLLRGTVSTVIWLGLVVALLQVWGLDALSWFTPGHAGRRLLSAAITVAIASLIAIAIWESVNAAMDRHIDKLTQQAQIARVVRLKTLLPMLRTTLLIAILAVVGLTALSEIGVNIAPLLAGAGIIGVAIGFGSQKLVQDLITGIFLLLENAMQVGDWITAAGLSGTVENLSIRTIRLRAGDGSVHIIPFSAVSTVNNANRGIGNAAITVSVAYTEDTDRVGQVLKQIAAELRQDENFKAGIRGDLELWGVDKIEGSVVTIVGQISCTDSARWGVQREFNRRMKKRFQELGIKIANPTHAIEIQPLESDEKQVAPGTTDPGPSSTNLPESPPPAAIGNTS